MATFDLVACLTATGSKIDELLANLSNDEADAVKKQQALAFSLGKDVIGLLARHTHATERLAIATEEIAKLARVDFEATVQAAVAANLDAAVKEKVAEKTKRTPLCEW